MMSDMRLIDADEIATSLTPADAVAALRRALLDGLDPAKDLERSFSELETGQMLFMPSQSARYAGVKVLTVTEGNDGVVNPRIQGSYLLNEAAHNSPLAVLDGAALTTLRTPAVSVAGVAEALGTRFPQVARLLVYGIGPQAIAHVDTLAAVVPVASVTVAVRGEGREAAFLAELGRRGLAGSAVLSGGPEAGEAVAAADVIVAATTSPEPLFDGSLVRGDAVVIAVGSHTRGARELDGELLGRASVIVESLHSARAEAGDVVLALAEGALREADLVTMAQAVREPERLAAGAPIVFKTTGMPWEDLIVAGAIFEKVSGR